MQASTLPSLRAFIEGSKKAAKRFRQLAAESDNREAQPRYSGLASALDNIIERAEVDVIQLGL
jgi:hypothetical protein